MTDTITPRRAENKFARRQSPSMFDNYQNTPRTQANPKPKKSQAFFIDANDDHQSLNDDPPPTRRLPPSPPPPTRRLEPSSPPPARRFKPLTPPPPARPFKPSTPPIHTSFDTTNSSKPEFYHLKSPENNDYKISSRHQSPIIVNNNRITPPPLENFSDTRPEMYYLLTVDESPRRPPSNISNHVKTNLKDDRTSSFDNDNIKPTMYLLTTTDGGTLPISRSNRTPTPPALLSKTSQPAPYDTYNYNNPTLSTVKTNIRHVPLSQSKASESIQRSMNKYRFGGY